MTTNAIDLRKRIISSDSRWSIEHGEKLYFIDDTGFDKIADRHQGSIICAGDGILIEQWRNWFTTPILNMAARPPYDRKDPDGKDRAIVVSLVFKGESRRMLSQGWYLLHGQDAKFCGSGAEYALECYSKNRCGRTSIGSAARQDPCTGGETKYVELDTFKHNLSAVTATLADALHMLQTKGNVMDLNTRNVTAISGRVPSELVAAISSGQVTLSAPTGQRIRLWTEAEKCNMDAALQELADMETAASQR